MAGLGIAIAWVGYWVMYYGVTQVQGGNWGFLDLGLPSRWANAVSTPRDNGSQTVPNTLPTATAPPPPSVQTGLAATGGTANPTAATQAAPSYGATHTA
jgi:hypothetical protein